MPEIAVLYNVGDQAELLGGFTVSTDSTITLSVSIQRLVSSSPLIWANYQVFPDVTGVSVLAGVEKTFAEARGAPYLFTISEIGIYRWVAFINAVGASETFYSEFQVIAGPSAGGVLSLISIAPNSVVLNYVVGQNFDHGLLFVIDPSGIQVQALPVIAGGRITVEGLLAGTRYTFYVNTFNASGLIGEDSNIVYATTPMSPAPEVPGVRPFFEIYVNNNPKGGSVVYWGLKRTFCDPGPYWFMLQWAEAPTGDWENVLATPVDNYWAIDPKPREFAKELESFYRIILTTSKGTYISPAHQATGTWTKREWLIARDITRKESLVHRKFVGWKGWLLKRKVWGPKCSCTDFDTQQDARGDCPICYGTGVVGGYWPGVLVYAYEQQAGLQRHKKFDDAANLRDDQHMQMRMIAYPHNATYDVFVHESSGRRFIVRNIGVIAELKGVPLVDAVEFRLAPFTDRVYDVPIEPPVYSETDDDEPTPGPVIESDDFLELPPKPEEDVQPPTEPEVPEAPIPDPELQVPVAPKHAIWWDSDNSQWYIGTTIGDQINALYRTLDGTLNPTLIPGYHWGAIKASPSSFLSLTTQPEGFIITSDEPGVAGSYIRAGTYEGMFVYLQQ